MTQQTLRFYRQSTLPVVANIGGVVGFGSDPVHGAAAWRCRSRFLARCGPDVDLYCFSGELRQVFANLIGNAIDAMAQGGHLWLSVRRSRSWVDGTPGIRLFVADNGCGMTPATRQRIFEPFFTTKETTGTGLGLWVSGEIIAKHNATVRVASRACRSGRNGEAVRHCIHALSFPKTGSVVPPR